MKKVLYPVLVAMVVIFAILSLPYIVPNREVKVYKDEDLRDEALSVGMRPVPKTYKELLKVVNNPANPLTRAKISLGKKLFFDPLLSRDKDLNCASCHILEDGGDDNIPTAIGHKGLKNPFHLNSPTVLNSALAVKQFWNGRANDVEEQAGGPVQAPFEMNMTPKEVEDRLKKVSEYIEDFKRVFGTNITFKNVQNAIGAYERTLLTYGKFDAFLEGDNSAMSKKAKKGLATFITRGCKGCHAGMAVGGSSIQKFPLRAYQDWFNVIFDPDLKVVNQAFPFENKGGFLGKDNIKRFRVPILRNITKTAPYFHNGAVKELEEAVRIMGRHQVGIKFTKEQIEEIVEFLKTLEGEIVDYKIND